MQKQKQRWVRLSVVAATLMSLGGTVLAEKPDWAGPPGKNKHRDEQRDERRDGYPSRQGGSVEIRIGGYFGDAQRTAANDYYRQQYRGGNCPPGLAKKNNGCLPPGQARKWAMGRPLPGDVVYYPIEPGIQIRLGTPPAGYKYVRVASDILLIAVGTSMVVDAIQDLGR
ncbi:MAG: hypothetical protein CK604_09035 [Curvibacter sp. PD_MW3]|nr:MAG: hypothetical protein CK604_09035 [Curvibacter sp. PD_MW3]